MSVVEDVQAYLAAQGIVDGSTDWPSVRRRVHDGSDQLVIVTEDGGLTPESPAEDGQSGDAAISRPWVQVRVRGQKWDGDSVQNKMDEIRTALHGRYGIVMGSGVYLSVTAVSEPVMFFDDEGRVNMTLSFQATRAEAFASA